jgi:hypothetical protein
MIDHVREWADSLASLPSIRLLRTIEVVGERDKHVSPRWEYARVTFRLEPHDGLEVRIAPSTKLQQMEDVGYLSQAAFGLLDVLLTRPTAPVRCVLVTILDAEMSEVESSRHAFRMAGRDAGEKALKELGAGT